MTLQAFCFIRLTVLGIFRVRIEVGSLEIPSSSIVTEGLFPVLHFARTLADNIYDMLEKLDVPLCIPVVSDSSITNDILAVHFTTCAIINIMTTLIFAIVDSLIVSFTYVTLTLSSSHRWYCGNLYIPTIGGLPELWWLGEVRHGQHFWTWAC